MVPPPNCASENRTSFCIHFSEPRAAPALHCYRSIPDFEAALKLVGEMGDHPAADSLRWIAELQQLVSRRPDKFTKVMTPAEKKLLEEILERSLGVARRKPTPKKAATKKTAERRKTLPDRTKDYGSPHF
jgi:hypothetical protein